MDLSILSANLRRVRTSRGLSQVALAEQAELSREGYRRIEDGQVEPRVDSLRRISSVLKVNLNELLLPVRELRAVRFRASKRMNTREDLLANVGRWLDAYAYVEKLLHKKLDHKLDELSAELRRCKRVDPKFAAARAREFMGLKPDESIRDICGLLEAHGIKVFTPSIASDSFFGLSIGAADGGPAIVVNRWERISVERWIFTAAHELGHLLLHLDAYNVDEVDEVDEEEKEGDIFAAHFLMPEQMFKKKHAEAAGLSWYDRIFKLKRLFRVSYRTVLYRIASDLPPAQRKNVWMRFNVEYKRHNGGRSLPSIEAPIALPSNAFGLRPAEKRADEPEHLDRHDFMQDRLAGLVRIAIEQDEVTMSKAAEILDLDLDEMRELANSWMP